jgi:hypothetical protein
MPLNALIEISDACRLPGPFRSVVVALTYLGGVLLVSSILVVRNATQN